MWAGSKKVMQGKPKEMDFMYVLLPDLDDLNVAGLDADTVNKEAHRGTLRIKLSFLV